MLPNVVLVGRWSVVLLPERVINGHLLYYTYEHCTFQLYSVAMQSVTSHAAEASVLPHIYGDISLHTYTLIWLPTWLYQTAHFLVWLSLGGVLSTSLTSLQIAIMFPLLRYILLVTALQLVSLALYSLYRKTGFNCECIIIANWFFSVITIAKCVTAIYAHAQTLHERSNQKRNACENAGN